MKKAILTVATVLITGLSLAQWTKKTVNNGLDDPYKICFTETNNGAYLKLQNGGTKIAFYNSGSYYCEDSPMVNISFLVNNEWVKHSIWGNRSSDNKTVFFTFDLANEVFFNDFLNSSSVKIRVNESYCTSEIYEFNMTGSTAAYNFIK